MARHSNQFDLLDEEDSDDLMVVLNHVVAKKTAKQLVEEEGRVASERDGGRHPQTAEATRGPLGKGDSGRGRGAHGDDAGLNGQRAESQSNDSHGRGNGRGGRVRGGGRTRGRGGRYYGDQEYGNEDNDADNRGFHRGGGDGTLDLDGAVNQNQERGNYEYQNDNAYYGRRGGRGTQWRGRGRGLYQDQGYAIGDRYYDGNKQVHGEGEFPYHEYENHWASNDEGYYGGREKWGYRNDTQGYRGGEGIQGRGNGRHVSQKWIPVSKNGDGDEKNADISNGKEELTRDIAGQEQTEDKSTNPEGSGSNDIPEKTQDSTNQPQPGKGDNLVTRTSENADEKEEDNEMTLDEYEKVLFEKRKALEITKSEVRKVDCREFEGMQVVGKKKEDNAPQKTEKEKLNKKGSSDKDEKVLKVVDMKEFLQLVGGETFNGRSYNQYRRGRGFEYQGGGYRGGEPGNVAVGGRGRGTFYSAISNENQPGEQRNRGFRGGYSGRSVGNDQGEGLNGFSDGQVENGSGGSMNGYSSKPAREDQGERNHGGYFGRSASQGRGELHNGRGPSARPAGQGQYFRRSDGGGYAVIRKGPPPKLEDQNQFPVLG